MQEELSRAEESKQRILLAAASIFSHKGLAGARVDGIAAAAKINKRMIYHYFGSKENLYVEVLRYNYQKIYQLSKEAFVADADPKENVARILHQYFYFLARDEEFVRLVSWESLHRGRYNTKVVPMLLDSLQGDLGWILEDGIKQGYFRADLDLHQTMLSIHSLCLAYFTRWEMICSLWPGELSDEILENRLNHILDLVFHGILN